MAHAPWRSGTAQECLRVTEVTQSGSQAAEAEKGSAALVSARRRPGPQEQSGRTADPC